MVGDNRAIRPVESGNMGNADKDNHVSADTENEEGWDDADGENFVDELKPGTKLFHGQFTIDRFLNSGGFGITYLARDSLERPVVIKECFPGSFCRRSTTIVRARSRAHQHEFRSIVRLFVQEARSLSKLIHPNIVGVHQVFEDNDTAYMAIDFVDGKDMLALIEDDGVEFTPDQVVSYLTKLLGAVDFIHRSGVLHRDISPDNILVNNEGEPILIDFGAAREEASKTSRALSALRVVKDGYSPQEFYISGSLQSDSSDLYALAASFYHVITGFPPPNSQARLAAIADDSAVDPYIPLAGRHEGYPPNFLEAIDRAMNVLPRDRIKSARAWLDMIEDGGKAAAEREQARMAAIDSAVTEMVTTGTVAPKAKGAEPVALNEPKPSAPKAAPPKPAAPKPVSAKAPAAPAPAVAPELDVQPGNIKDDLRPSLKVAAAHAKAERSGSGSAMIYIIGGAVVAAAAAGYFILGSGTPEETEGPTTEIAASATSPANTTSPAVTPAPAPEPTTVAPAEASVSGPTPAVEEPAPAEETAAAPAEPEVTAAAVEPAEPEVAAAPGPAAPGPATPEVASVEPTPEPALPTPEVSGAVDTTAAGTGSESTATATVEIAALPEPTPEPAPVEVQPAPEPEVAGTAPEEPADTVVTAIQPALPETPVAVEPVPEPAPAAVVPQEPGKLLDNQFVSTGWEVQLPFQIEMVEASGRSFPMITSVDQGALRLGDNAWMQEGVVIFAVNDEWVTGEDDIRTLIEQSSTLGDNDFLKASVRIRPSGSEQFEHVDLVIPAMRVVELANGAKFRATFEDNRWKSRVEELPTVAGSQLKIGDEIVSENVTAQGVRYSQSVEAFVELLTRRQQPRAEFSVLRDGEVVPSVVMPLATE